jgi:hypothetical protein
MATRMNRFSLGVVVVASAQVLAAQSIRPVATHKQLPVRETVADAEAEGATFPHGSTRERGPTVWGGRTPARRTCTLGPTTVLMSKPSEDRLDDLAIDSQRRWEIRSGDFIIGGQIGGDRPPRVGWQSKIWWAPYHNPEEYKTKLVVRGARLGVRGDTIRYEQAIAATPRGGAKTDSFFPSGLAIPRAGRWLLIATAGDDWGCFILSTGA